MNVAERIFVPIAQPVQNANIRPLYPINHVPWIWHPGCPRDAPAALLFRNEFRAEDECGIILHVSADQRYELSLDGELISVGPDRGDMDHWAFASYRIMLAPGNHVLEALVWWIGESAPAANVTYRGGFVLAAEGMDKCADAGAKELGLDTGSPSWRVRELKGWSFEHGFATYFTGLCQTINGAEYYADTPFVEPVVVEPPITANVCGIMRSCWRMYPSPLPDQLIREIRCGKVRAVIAGGLAGDVKVKSSDLKSSEIPKWKKMMEGDGVIEIPPHATISALCDLEDYYCAHPMATLSGGAGSEITFGWSEGLHEPNAEGKSGPTKGNRDEIEGKFFLGNWDRFRNDGGKDRKYRSNWWRAGRYLLITVKTADEPLVIEDVRLLETRYPLENESLFESNDASLDEIIPILVRGMQMCSHETFMDCPYYEQLMYVGDSRLEMLTTYVLTQDPRLVRRGIELFDWSRWMWGQVAEHYPSRVPQQSPTFSLIWVALVHDHAMWRGDRQWIGERMTGVRGVLELFRDLIGPGGLLEKVPGWPFVDWVREWDTGNAPEGYSGISSINNLFFIQALRMAAELEDYLGEGLMAERNRQLARELGQRVIDLFWVESDGLLADDPAHEHFSEHAQCLALLNDVLDEERARRSFAALLTRPDLSRTSIYFSWYLLETFRKFDRADLIVGKMGFWRELKGQGFKTPIESPEPSRSDCHAWGSHPLFHFHATLCGIRPAGFGFEKVMIAPKPGPLKRIHSKLAHAKGIIEADLRFGDDGKCRGFVQLPEGLPGVLRWGGNEMQIAAGEKVGIDLGLNS